MMDDISVRPGMADGQERLGLTCVAKRTGLPLYYSS